MLIRRAVLEKCVALGSVTIASESLADPMLAAFEEHESQRHKPTPPNQLGPFYKRLAPFIFDTAGVIASCMSVCRRAPEGK
jgi:hypothetical protein